MSKIRNTAMMDRLVDYLMDNISNLTSAWNIKDVFEKKTKRLTIKRLLAI